MSDELAKYVVCPHCGHPNDASLEFAELEELASRIVHCTSTRLLRWQPSAVLCSECGEVACFRVFKGDRTIYYAELSPRWQRPEMHNVEIAAPWQ